MGSLSSHIPGLCWCEGGCSDWGADLFTGQACGTGKCAVRRQAEEQEGIAAVGMPAPACLLDALAFKDASEHLKKGQGKEVRRIDGLLEWSCLAQSSLG